MVIGLLLAAGVSWFLRRNFSSRSNAAKVGASKNTEFSNPPDRRQLSSLTFDLNGASH